MLAPQERLEEKAVTHRRGVEGALPARRHKPIEIPAAVGDAVILIVAAMQPDRWRFVGGAPFEDQRIDGLMRGAGSSEPAAIEIDGADKAFRSHARIGDRQDAATRGAADSDAPEIDIFAGLEMGHDGIDIGDGSLETASAISGWQE